MNERSLVHHRWLSHSRVVRTGFRLIRFTTALLLLVASFPDAGFALSPGGRQVRDLICNKNIRFSDNLPWYRHRLAQYTFLEDGATTLIRTGYEVALFSRLKKRLYDRAQPLLPEQVFLETIDAMIDVKRVRQPTGPVHLNIFNILMTAHNVTRLLARPEQWSGERSDPLGRMEQFTNAGQNRVTDDKAFPIMLDLRGIRSVDRLPTTLYLADSKAKRFDQSYIYKAFYGQNGVFRFYADAVLQPRAVKERNRKGWTAAHWNGGIHYYAFIGALAWLSSTVHATQAASELEGFIKWSMGDPVRSEVQRNYGFSGGVSFITRFYAGFNELSADDKRCFKAPTKPLVHTQKKEQTKKEESKRVCRWEYYNGEGLTPLDGPGWYCTCERTEQYYILGGAEQCGARPK